MKGSRLVLFLIFLCTQGRALEKAAEMKSCHPEMEMKVEVGELDLGICGTLKRCSGGWENQKKIARDGTREPPARRRTREPLK